MSTRIVVKHNWKSRKKVSLQEALKLNLWGGRKNPEGFDGTVVENGQGENVKVGKKKPQTGANWQQAFLWAQSP